MGKVFGTIKTGETEKYALIMFSMEGNLLKLHRMDPARNARKTLESIRMCLLKVDGYIRGVEYSSTM